MIRPLAALVIAGLVLAGCGRPLTDTETAFLADLHGDSVDLSRVRLVDSSPAGSVTFRRKARPRVTCRERILPPPTDAIVTSTPAAVALFNQVMFSDGWYLEDYLPDWPERIYLVEAMLLAHEVTHVWQWQNRAVTGYSPLRAAREHATQDDPYLFELAPDRTFLDFGFEQQGTIVEEYVCCRALAPDGARTLRLHALLAEVMPVAPLPTDGREGAVVLPSREADLDGICT